MNAVSHKVILRLSKFLNILLITVPFGVCWYLYYASLIQSPFWNRGNWVVVLLFLFFYSSYVHIYDGLLISVNPVGEVIYSQILAQVISNILMYMIIWLLTKTVPDPRPLLLAFAAEIVLTILWSVGVSYWYFTAIPPRRTIVLYDVRQDVEDLIRNYKLARKYDIRQNMHIKQCIEAEMAPLAGMQVAFLCGVHSHERNQVVKYCVANGITVYLLPRIGDVIMSGAKQMHMFHLPMLRVQRYDPPVEYIVIKRLMDILLSALMLVLTSPILLVTAAAIKLTDGGPVFYKQCRLTKDGKEFDLVKFRSMRVDAEKDGVARLSSGENDDRITPVGHIIRKVRLDELPQLLNILKGEMSIVGPRPERPEIARQCEEQMPEFALRLQAKAGLTGYAQVYGKYNTTFYDKLQMDLMYIAHPSIVGDIKIIFATVKILFMAESTEGVASGEIPMGQPTDHDEPGQTG